MVKIWHLLKRQYINILQIEEDFFSFFEDTNLFFNYLENKYLNNRFIKKPLMFGINLEEMYKP